MSFKPLSPYMHDGQRLHPKLAYTLPPGMGEKLVALGLFAESEDPADVDLSHVAWDADTRRADHVSPSPLTNAQNAP